MQVSGTDYIPGMRDREKSGRGRNGRREIHLGS